MSTDDVVPISTGTFTIGGDLILNRLGFASMQLTIATKPGSPGKDRASGFLWWEQAAAKGST
jgi:hypothetical protein